MKCFGVYFFASLTVLTLGFTVTQPARGDDLADSTHAYLTQRLDVQTFAQLILNMDGDLSENLADVVDEARTSNSDPMARAGRLLELAGELQVLLDNRRERTKFAVLTPSVLGALLNAYLSPELIGGGVFEPMFQLLQGATDLLMGAVGGAAAGYALEQVLRTAFHDRQIKSEVVEKFRQDCTAYLLSAG